MATAPVPGLAAPRTLNVLLAMKKPRTHPTPIASIVNPTLRISYFPPEIARAIGSRRYHQAKRFGKASRFKARVLKTGELRETMTTLMTRHSQDSLNLDVAVS